MSHMRWSEAPLPENGGSNNSNNSGAPMAPSTPQIKNHSVTYHRSYLYCFGGYDGRRNHQTLLIYSLREQRWITPSITGIGMNGLGGGNDGAHYFTVHGTPPPGRNGHTATLATCRSSRRNRINGQRARNYLQVNPNDIDFNHNSGNSNSQGGESGHPSEAEEVVDQALAELAEAIDAMDAELENHSSKNANDNSQGGDDDNSQPNSYEHNPNEDMDDDANNNNQQQMEENEDMDDDEDAQIIIIGGWLGSGPLAASDMWVLDISGGLERLRWFQPVSTSSYI